MDDWALYRQNWSVRKGLMWIVLTLSVAIYVPMLIWAATAYDSWDLATLVWAVGLVPSMIVAGVIMIVRRPANPIGAIALWGGLTMFLIPTILEIPTTVVYEQSGQANWMWAPMWAGMTLSSVGFVLVMSLVVLLPDGRIRYPRERRFLRVAWITALLPTLSLISNEYVVTFSQMYPGFDDIASPLFVPALQPLGPAIAAITSLAYALFIGALVLQYLRYRMSSERERKQVRWVLLGGTAGIAIGLIPYLLEEIGIITPISHGSTLSWLSVLPFVLFMASIVIAVLEPPWVDIDIVIRKSFVYGALSFAILILYIAVAATLGVAAGARLNIEIAVVLTVVIALLFQPARSRLQAVADRWVFGVRPTKYEAVTEFGETIDQAADPAELIPQLVETIRKTLGLVWVTASLDDGTRAQTGRVSGEPVLTAVIGTGDDEIGMITCGPKHEGSLDSDETQLVHTLAGQVGLAVMNARLASRIVNAAENERRRIERNIHDGAQQELVALVARLGMARTAASQGELDASQIEELQGEARQILTDLRELAQGIHPSVLSDGGILEAVEERCTHIPLDVTLDAPEEMRSRRYSDDVEGAAYFFVTESLTNVLKHAEASQATVSLTPNNGRLNLDVSDNGKGFETSRTAQNGLAGLSDRIKALGGSVTVTSRPGQGTSVNASLPVD